MNIRKATIEELLDYQQELHIARDEEKEGSLGTIVQLYEELFRRISRDPNSEYRPSLSGIKKRLISYLIRYGTYLKTEYKKDDKMAQNALKKAVSIDRRLPIAYYRLGFLSYKEHRYSQSLTYFEKALQMDNTGDYAEYQLNDLQHYNALLYTVNSALYIAEITQKELERQHDVQRESLPNVELSALYDMIIKNEHYLNTNAFTVVSAEGIKRVSKEGVENLLDTPGNEIVLYFSGQRNLLIYNCIEKELSKNQAEMLRYFLLYSREQKPASKNDFYDLFASSDESGGIPNNTYTQNVTRLRNKLDSIGIKEVIENQSTPVGPSYFFNETLPFLIVHRSDANFILN